MSAAGRTSRVLWWSGALVVVPAALAAVGLGQVGPPPAAPGATAITRTVTAPATRTPDAAPVPPLSAVPAVLAARPILFGPDSAELAEGSAATVERVAALLVTAPPAPVLVEGHVADTPGGVAEGRRLSEERAAVVAQALVAAGVPAERITTRGRGAEQPLATVERSRRVEITVG